MIRIPRTIKLGNEAFMCIFSFLFFAISDISRMFELLGIPRAVSYVPYLAMFAVFFLRTFKQMKLYDILYFLIVIPIVLWGVIMYKDYIGSDSRLYVMFIVFIPSYYFFRFCDLESMLKGLVASAYYSVVYLLLYYVLYVTPANATYNMNYAYWIATPMCVLFYCYLRKRRILDLILTLVSFYTLISFGSRGALGLAVAAMAYLYVFTTHDGKKEKTNIGWAIALIALVLVFWNPILEFLNENFEDSRSIEKLINGEFMESHTRDDLYKLSESMIALKPGGYGPLASREIFYGDSYPHSLFYELQLDYGQVIGIAVFVVIMFMTLKNLWDYRKNKMQILAALMCVIGICSLFVSSSYFYEMYVPAVIALFVTMRRVKKEEKRCLSLSNATDSMKQKRCFCHE